MGSLKTERLEKPEVRPGIREISAGGSRFDTWLAMKMHARPAGTFLTPSSTKRMPATRKPARTMKQDHLVQRSHVAGNRGQRNEDDRRGNAQHENDYEDENRNNHGNSSKLVLECRSRAFSLAIDLLRPIHSALSSGTGGRPTKSRFAQFMKTHQTSLREYRTRAVILGKSAAPVRSTCCYVRIHSGNPEAMAARTACVNSSRVAKSAGVDRRVEDDVRRSWLHAQAAFAQDIFRSVDGDRYHRRASGQGQEEGAFLEGQHAAVR